jgi:hypothetical protein
VNVPEKSRRRRQRVYWLLGVALVLASCDKVWGIEQAGLDPALADAGPVSSPACLSYCNAVTANCTGNNNQYGDLQTCLAVCAVIPEGMPGDIGVNTVQCRLKMAQAAPAEPESFCTAAGPAGELPGGSNGCGTACDGFCTMVMAFCTDQDAAALAYPNEAACYSDCMGLQDLGSFSLAPDSGATAGSAVQCRVYHATAASQLASLHCRHALGAAPCD